MNMIDKLRHFIEVYETVGVPSPKDKDFLEVLNMIGYGNDFLSLGINYSDLMCCGNCKHYDYDNDKNICKLTENFRPANNYCEGWEFDDIDYYERLLESEEIE